MSWNERTDREIYGDAWAQEISRFRDGVLREGVSVALEAVAAPVRRGDWQNGFRKFDRLNPALGLGRQEELDYYSISDIPYNWLAGSVEEDTARVASVGSAVVACSLSLYRPMKEIAYAMPRTTIADHMHSAVDIANNHWAEARKIRDQVKAGHREFGALSKFVDVKADQSSTIGMIFGESSVEDAARFSFLLKRASMAYFLAAAAGLGMTGEVERTPTSLIELVQLRKPLGQIETSVARFNRYGFNLENHFRDNPVALHLYEELANLNETADSYWFDIYNYDQLKAQKQTFNEACFGVIDNLCSDRFFKKGLNQVDEEVLLATAETAFKRSREIAWRQYVDPGIDEYVKARQKLEVYPLLRSRLSVLDLFIAKRFAGCVGYDNSPGRFEAMSHAGLAVVMTLAWYVEQQKESVHALSQI